jgi:HD-GYP domain-containing protein (c-di-GMP phosphodiesterase class II)
VLGQEASSIIGLCFKDYLPPETAEVVIVRFNGVKDSLQPLTFDDSFIFGDRELFYLTTLFPLFNSCGKIRSVGAISHDVTAIKEAEHKLGSTLEVYRKGLEGMIKSMGTLMSKRDRYTADHQLRVARLAAAIAEELGLATIQRIINCHYTRDVIIRDENST